jgi:hypothetical protein
MEPDLDLRAPAAFATAEVQPPPRAAPRPKMETEPGTSAALWPTFMRRTLTEDVVAPH